MRHDVESRLQGGRDGHEPGARAVSRRTVLRAAAGGFGLFFVGQAAGVRYAVEATGRPRLLDPRSVPKYAAPLLIPPVMPRARTDVEWNGAPVDYYEISMRQFRQQVLPAPLPTTTVWGYGPAATADPDALALHNAPSMTVEATVGRPVRIRWVNQLVDGKGRYRPHLLPVDPTLHWANPKGGRKGRDTRPDPTRTPGSYNGPVPMVTHLHGANGVGDDSDGYAEAWFLPDARDIPKGTARVGTWYAFFRRKSRRRFGARWGRGASVSQYPNTQRASTLWFHDHTLGMTRLNVYAGPAGFFLLRGGPEGDAAVTDSRTGLPAVLPGPAPREGDPFPGGPYYEIPMAVQDRSFGDDGALFYPDSREFFDGIKGPYIPKSDVPPIWNPEFFGNTIIVNGATWPRLQVEQRRYRFRVLNGCNSRFLILDFASVRGVRVWQIGNEGGFLAAPVDVSGEHRARVLLSPAERADLIVDFTDVPVGGHVLRNVGPDEPYGGGEPGEDFPVADPDTTGQVLRFDVVPATSADATTPPQFLDLPEIAPLAGGRVRRLVVLEEMSMRFDGPVAGELGVVDSNGRWTSRDWAAAVTENPGVGDTEVWELYNATADAHPMHIHEVFFQVIDRQPIDVDEEERRVRPRGTPRGPEPWERGWKDTVIAYPGEVTRIRMRFGTAGQYVWHCHIVEHEDNEMMRPLRVGPKQPGQPPDGTHEGGGHSRHGS